MSSLTSNPKAQLLATAAVSAAVAAGAVLTYQRLQKGDRASQLKQSIPGSTESGQVARVGPLPKPDKEDEYNQMLAQRALSGDFDEELVLEQLARNRVFLGEAGLEKLRTAFV